MRPTDTDRSAQPSGERLVLDASDPDLRNEHLARYCFAEPLARGRRVLDVGCGEGYGTARFVGDSAAVYGLDNSEQAISSARANSSGVVLVRGDCVKLPFADASLDLVTAFEVIEHLNGREDFISEAARVLGTTGVFVVSTPNRDYYQTTRDEPNPFHVHEFAYEEFHAALTAAFRHCAVFLENHVGAVSISSPSAGETTAHVETREADPASAHFFVAVCSMRPLNDLQGLAFLPRDANLLREREQHIAKLREWVAALESRHEQVEHKMSRELSRWPYRVLRRLRLAPKLPREW
ncbi:MAG: class I SAM-dependent methyltransferase [Bryobacterales bacterium]|nr:class I SAM-dependent methyltransferase [Bryobacterales bacterium]